LLSMMEADLYFLRNHGLINGFRKKFPDAA